MFPTLTLVYVQEAFYTFQWFFFLLEFERILDCLDLKPRAYSLLEKIKH